MSHKARFYFPVLCVLLLIAVLYYLLSPRPYHPQSTNAYQAGYVPEENMTTYTERHEEREEWKKYQPALGTFTAFLPAMPQHASESVPLPENRDSIKYNMYLSQSRAGSSFLINVIEYPPSFNTDSSTVLLDGVVSEMLSGNASNTLLEKSHGNCYNYPAVDFVLQTQSGILVARGILVGKTMYVLTVLDLDKAQARENFVRFVDGFAIVKK